MPALGEKAQRAWAELKESCGMVLEIEKEGLKLTEIEVERSLCLIKERLRRKKDCSGGLQMSDCQGRGRVTRQGQHVATVEYLVQSETDAVDNPIHGDVEVIEGQRSLSPGDQYTLHMEGSLDLDFQVEQANHQVEGKHQIRGVGVFRKSV
jgi:hypothetical protein